jgi:hypothetical protein
MTETERLALTLRLRAVLEQAGALFEDIANGASDRTVLAGADELVNRAGVVLAQAVAIATPPGAYQFRGDSVELAGPDVRAGSDADKAAQRYIGLEKLDAEAGWTEQARWDSERLEKALAEAGVTSLLDDTASVVNSDRDHRGAA